MANLLFNDFDWYSDNCLQWIQLLIALYKSTSASPITAQLLLPSHPHFQKLLLHVHDELYEHVHELSFLYY